MAIDRRHFLGGLIALGLAATFPATTYSAPRARGFLSTARDKLSGRFLMARVDADLDIVWETPLPARAHGIVVAPDKRMALVAARRPGRFMLAVDLATGDVLQRIDPATGRHFYGHAVFDRTGGMVYTTENAFDKGTGVIGVYDATDGFKRIGEFASGGIGPHQLLLMPNGRTLAVANGGIRTHPDRGREKLNLDTMRSSLTLIDADTGRIAEDFRLNGEDQRQLSLRHICVDGPRVVVVAQDQAAAPRAQELAFWVDSVGGSALRPLGTPDALSADFNGYCGAVAADPGTGTIAVTSPRGGIVALWHRTANGYAWLGEEKIADGCGVDAQPELGGCVVTSGQGTIRRYDPAGHVTSERAHPFRQWDNHLTTLS